MKKLFLSFIALMPIAAAAQETGQSDPLKVLNEAAEAVETAPKVEVEATPAPRYWKNSLQTKLDFGQTSLTNWAAGGYNTISLKTFIDANANYEKDKMFWNNRLQLDYGFLYSADKPILQKSDDRIYLESKWGYQAKDELYYSVNFSFRSQFSNTSSLFFQYPTASPARYAAPMAVVSTHFGL